MVSESKIVSRAQLLNLVHDWRRAEETIVFTNGVFDLLHCGHLLSFEKAASFGSRLIVGVNSDRSVKTLNKGPARPINIEHDRALLIAGLRVVEAVTIFDEETPFELLAELHPDVLVKGGDYQLHEVVGREFCDRVELIEILPGYSSSRLIDRILAAHVNLENTR